MILFFFIKTNQFHKCSYFCSGSNIRQLLGRKMGDKRAGHIYICKIVCSVLDHRFRSLSSVNRYVYLDASLIESIHISFELSIQWLWIGYCKLAQSKLSIRFGQIFTQFALRLTVSWNYRFNLIMAI